MTVFLIAFWLWTALVFTVVSMHGGAVGPATAVVWAHTGGERRSG